MQIDEIVWLSKFVAKLRDKHAVRTREVEEVLNNRPYIRRASRGRQTGEDVYSAMGQTDEGRYLIVIFILKPYRRALVISARDMDKKERTSYEKRK